MANVAVTSSAWTEISITSGTVQNISATADIELSAEQVNNSGVVLKPSEIYQWDNETIYARAVTEDTGALRVVNFKKAAGGGGGYVLPVATASKLGGVKIGSNVSIDENGVISVAAPYSLPTAAANTLGGVKVGSNLSIDENGVLSATGGGGASYSTTEQVVGTWTDGKPLYQKTYINSDFTQSGNEYIADIPANIQIKLMSGGAIDATNYPVSVPYVDLSNMYFISIYADYVQNKVYIRSVRNSSFYAVYVDNLTIKYTKTTD